MSSVGGADRGGDRGGSAGRSGRTETASRATGSAAKADKAASATKAKEKAQAAKKDPFAKDTFAPATLKNCPVTGPLRSSMGTRTHPVTGQTHTHKGIDIKADTGTPVRAAHDGIVSASTYQMGKNGTGYGNYVSIDGTNVKSLSAHLSERSVQVGQQVRAGDVIGLSGATGGVTGPHVHFETREQTASGWSLTNPKDVFERSGLDCIK